jgi:hypothetical protein
MHPEAVTANRIAAAVANRRTTSASPAETRALAFAIVSFIEPARRKVSVEKATYVRLTRIGRIAQGDFPHHQGGNSSLTLIFTAEVEGDTVRGGVFEFG